MKQLSRLICLLILSGSYFSCTDFGDLEGISNDVEDAVFAIPIATAEFSLDDLLDNLDEGTTVIIDADGTIRLNYKDNLAVQTSLDVFESIQNTLNSIPIFPVTDTLIALPFGAPDSVDIDLMRLKSGRLGYSIVSDLSEPVTFNYEFVNVLKDGESLKGSTVIPPFFPVQDSIKLAGYDLVPTNDSIYFRYEAYNADGERILLPNFLMTINNITFSYTEGYFGQIVHEGDPDTIQIEFFDNWTRGDVYFENPTISIYTKNSFGVPTKSIVHYFNVKTVNENILPLESPFITNGVNFGYPKLPDEVGQTVIDTFTFNKNNSNIDVILGAGPEQVYYDVDALTNPDRDTSFRGFITDESKYEIQVEVDLPLYGRASGFAVRDTIAWDFTAYEDVDYAEFKIVTENEMGVEVDIQAYFVDDTGVVLDSLFTAAQTVIPAAAVDASGLPTGTARQTTIADFPAARFEYIKPAKKIILVATFFTRDRGDTSVRVLNSQEVSVRMGMKLGK